MPTPTQQRRTSATFSTKVLAAVVLVVTMMASALIAASPAHASDVDQFGRELTPLTLVRTETEGPASTGVGGLYGSDVAQAIGMGQLWAAGYTGRGIDVAVIDTGVSPAAGLDMPGKVIDGPDFSFDSGDEKMRHRDWFGHGTAMAGLVAGQPQRRLGKLDGDDFATGTAPGARIVNVKVGDRVGAVDVSQVIAAIDWVVQNKTANGMNMQVLLLAYDTDSIQDYQIDPLSFAVENAWRHGIVVVVSGGNEGRQALGLGNPATNPYVLAVGGASAVGTAWTVPMWSSAGDGVRNPDLVVPGQQVLAPAVLGSFLANKYPEALFETPDGMMLRGSGTSQAAASAAGAVAVLLEARPNLSPDEVKAALTGSAKLIGQKDSKELIIDPRVQGHGMLLVSAALKSKAEGSAQWWTPANGMGSLEASRGSYHIGNEKAQLVGEITAFGDPWQPEVWVKYTTNAMAYDRQRWSDDGWRGGRWLGQFFKGANWNGTQWSVADQVRPDGDDWAGFSWSGVLWSGFSWSGMSWSGISWSGVTWSGMSWSSADWS